MVHDLFSPPDSLVAASVSEWTGGLTAEYRLKLRSFMFASFAAGLVGSFNTRKRTRSH
jgi:hypothetical protein